MSQVLFKGVLPDLTPVEVMAGWDRPCAHFFLTVFDMREDAPEETLWSTVDYPDPVDRTGTTRLRQKLADMGLQTPAGFWEVVEKREENVRHQMGETH